MDPFRIIRALLPHADRDEIVDELRAEYEERRARSAYAARVWAWRQAAGSLPWLVRRSWDRGWTGWESESNRMRPGGGSMLERLIMDGRHALRRLRKRPAYTLLAVLTLALGVGGTAAVYSLVRTLLIDALPYAVESELASFWMPYDWSEAEYTLLADDLPAEVSGLAAYRPQDVTYLSPGSAAQLVKTIAASATLFDVLGVRPLLGPGFRPGDDRPGAERVAVLSHGFWQELGGDAAIVGSTLNLGGVPRTVVGVMPRGFWFPDASVRVWVPQWMRPDNGAGNYAFVARFAGGAGGAAAASALPRITQRLDERFDYPPQWNKLAAPVLTPLRDTLVASVRPALLATLAAMAIILLIASANVAALMLGQVNARTTEVAVRRALGASGGQLLQQIMMEAAALGVGAGIAGAFIAFATFGVLTTALPLGALAERATLDWSVFVTATAIALVAALAVSLAPALSLWRGDPRAALSTSRTAGVRGGRGGRLEQGLVVVEVALAVLMAAGAALLIRSVANLRAIDAGVNTQEVAVLDIVFGAEFDAAGRQRILRALAPQLEAVPGVRTAAAIHKLPLRGSGDNWGIRVRGEEAAEVTTTAYRIVTPAYFDALDQSVESGRAFAESDAAGETVVVINRSLAERYFPGVDPVGRHIGTGYDTTWARIIGVVENAADGALIDDPSPSRYMLYAQLPFAPEGWSLVLRAEPGHDPAAVLGAARDIVRREAPGVAIQATTTMGAVFALAMGPARQLMGLLLLLAALAITLGALGVYGVVSHFVQRRRRDWSIRMALGLRPARLVGEIVRRGGVLVVLGIVGGLLGSVLFMRVLRSFLYGVGAADPIAFLLATATLLTIGLLAAFVPARRASRADPAAVLREQ